MAEEKLDSSNEKTPSTPNTEERGLQPAKNPPPMPQVKPPKAEKES